LSTEKVVEFMDCNPCGFDNDGRMMNDQLEQATPRILVVDDTPANLQVVGEILSRNIECDLSFATDGQQALDSVAEMLPDIVLLDVMMPGMDGFTVFRMMKENPATTDIPVLFLTAKVEASDVVVGFKAGAVDYITKPFNPAELIARVQTQLKIRQATHSLAARTEALQASLHKLEKSERFLRTVIQSLPHPFAVINAQDFRVEMANAAFTERAGEGRKCFAEWDGNAPECEKCDVPCPLADVRRTGKPCLVEQEQEGADGEMVYNEVHAYPVLDEAGRVVQIIESVFDITERKTTDARIRELEKSDSLGRMAGAVAHHYNNMMAVVIGNLELVLLDQPDDEPVHEEINEALRAARRAADMGGLMLAYLGQTRAPRSRIDFAAVATERLAEFRKDLPGTVNLVNDLPATGVWVSANQEQMQQVVSTLLTNATEALTNQAGEVIVRLEEVAHDDLEASNRYPRTFTPAAGRYMVFSVTDNGVGIEPAAIERIFDPFYSTKFLGRGLGLAVAMSALKAHAGCMLVKNNAEQGACFELCLPLSTESEEVSAPAVTAQPDAPFKAGTVLLAEDDDAVRTMAANMLKRIGWAVVEAHDGAEAVELFRAQADVITCAICDLTMPNLDGWQTIEALRQIQPGLPVILASGYDQASAMAGEHAELPQAFLHKPYLLSRLTEAMKTAMAGSTE
jgi:CheY-like chemotaxis protein